MITYLGIRHHGPGSCRNVMRALKKLRPDVILLEGPAEASCLVPMVTDEDMRPPVAILAFQSDNVRNASFYPFAEFSPEWQTMLYAAKNGVECRFFDLPLSNMMAMRDMEEYQRHNSDFEADEADPFNLLARIEGLPDGEAWWDTHVERAANSDDIFGAVEAAVAELRIALPKHTSLMDLTREAWMRKQVRQAVKDGFQNIAVVCGAWHVPGIKADVTLKSDSELLKGLPKIKVECTWIPWTYSRLMLRSGYGAGIEFPGWYSHIFRHPGDNGTHWITKAAKILRTKHIDVSVAHVVDAVRLANSLTMLRGLSVPSPREFNDAMVSVFSQGDDYILRLLRSKLLVDNKLGSVPKDVPKVPLLADFEATQRRLRLQFSQTAKEMVLDLRKPLDLERSTFFYRLKLMDLQWASKEKVDGKGTFKEAWTLRYKPELLVQIIELAIFGNTVETAAQTLATAQAGKAQSIRDLTRLLDDVVPANLPAIAEALTQRLDQISVASHDVIEMMDAVPDLTDIVLYGNVRNIDYSNIRKILSSFIVRVTAAGVQPCQNIDEEQASEIIGKITGMDMSVSSLNDGYYNDLWVRYLQKLRSVRTVSPLISGFASRRLYDKSMISTDEMLATLSYYTSPGNKPNDVAYWFEGFFRQSGTILLIDDNLWLMLNTWIQGLVYETFVELLPIMRRTFSSYSANEKEKLAQKARAYDPNRNINSEDSSDNFNYQDAARVLPLIRRLLGMGE